MLIAAFKGFLWALPYYSHAAHLGAVQWVAARLLRMLPNDGCRYNHCIVAKPKCPSL